MMVTWVRGHFKNIRGFLNFDPEDPSRASVRAEIDAKTIWAGEPDRDAHLRSADFLDVEHHPKITFVSTGVEVLGQHEYRVKGDLTIRGVTRPVTLDLQYLGQWETPYWEEGVDKFVHGLAGLHHQHGAPGPLQAGDEFLDAVATDELLALASAVHEIVDLADGPVIAGHRKAIALHVEHQVFAHYRQTD
jgi:hypothetical protein